MTPRRCGWWAAIVVLGCGQATKLDAAAQLPAGWVRTAGDDWEVWAPGPLVPPDGAAPDVPVRLHEEGITTVWKIATETLACTPSAAQARALLQRRAAEHKEGLEPDSWSERELEHHGHAAHEVRFAALGVNAIHQDVVVGARVHGLEVVSLGQLAPDTESFFSSYVPRPVASTIEACSGAGPAPAVDPQAR